MANSSVSKTSSQQKENFCYTQKSSRPHPKMSGRDVSLSRLYAAFFKAQYTPFFIGIYYHTTHKLPLSEELIKKILDKLPITVYNIHKGSEKWNFYQ